MACCLNKIARFQDIKEVKRYLFPDSQTRDCKENDSDWDDTDWNWEESDQNSAEEVQNDELADWLQHCPLCLSPALDFFAIANEDRIVLLSQKWDPQEKSEVQSKFSIVYEGTLGQEEGEKITSVLCMPLASQKRSTHGGPDWTCLIVGFSTGYVRMYTENGTQLLSQIFSENPVHQLKCQTYELPRHSADAEKHEELNILYTKNLVVIDGFSLYQTLKACRNQVARATASGSEAIQPPPLAYKKWGLQDQQNINDFISCGVTTPNPFDQMQTASMIGGYGASIRPTPPAMHKYVTAGSLPFVGVYCAIEGSTQPMLSDVAHAVAHKLKSALFSQISAASGWLGFGGKQAHEEKKETKRPKIEPATGLSYRYCMPDKRRHGEMIVLAPDNKLAATTDSFGRVLLLDLEKGICVRMWKGYRDAQVGWMVVKESGESENRSQQTLREALFLVIYAPRRGILEVWTAQQGPRVAAFNISKNCCLLCPGYGMMGLNNVTCRGVKSQLFQCALVDSDGSIKVIDIPFHLALSDKNSKKVRDMHLVKKLKLLLKEVTDETDDIREEISSILSEIKTPCVKQQGLERIFHSKVLSADTMLEFIKEVKQQKETPIAGASSASIPESEKTSSGTDMCMEDKILLHFCNVKEKQLTTYLSLLQVHKEENSDRTSTENSEASQNEMLCNALGLTLEELEHIKHDVDHYQNILDFTPHVRFAESTISRPIQFLAAFDDETHVRDNLDAKGHELFTIKEGLVEEQRVNLAGFLFGKSATTKPNKKITEVLKESGLPPEQLMSLLLDLWLSTDKRDLYNVLPFFDIVSSITGFKESSEIAVNNGQVSPWWQFIRQTCSQTHNICSALLAVLVCRTVASQVANEYKAENDFSSSFESEWESVTMDHSHWTLLCKQLEDLLHLQTLLQMKPEQMDSSLVASDAEPTRVSVKKAIEGGRGIFAELVAKWIASQGVRPSMLCMTAPVQSETEEPMETNEAESGKLSESYSKPPLIAQFEKVQKKLPYSLETDILVANGSWEYAVLWNKDPEVVSRLEQAVSFLQCVQNPELQQGIASMMWHVFLVKKISASAFLIEKVGKAPKERLCRKDVGMSDITLQRFFSSVSILLDLMLQVGNITADFPLLGIEDPWQATQRATSLVELATEQKETNLDIVQHHSHLVTIMHAVMTFSLKSVKPLSLFDTAGKSAFFKPLHSHPSLPSNHSIDTSISKQRINFLCRVISQAVMTLGDPPPTPKADSMEQATPPLTLSSLKDFPAIVWPEKVLNLAREMDLDLDEFRRCHTCELYSSGFDKQGEEILRTVNDHSVIGLQLLLIAGKRLAHFIFVCDPPGCVEKLSQCSPTVSTWLKQLNPNDLRHPNAPLRDTAELIGQAVNQLPEGHSQYNLAISLVDLMQSLM